MNAARPRADAKGIQLEYDEPEEPVLALMDRTRIAQVVSNLLDNALQHTPQGGRVEVSLALSEGDRVRVAVADDGEGIPEEDLERVFDRFYRVDSSRSRASGGAGLGLTIVKGWWKPTAAAWARKAPPWVEPGSGSSWTGSAGTHRLMAVDDGFGQV